MKKILTVSLALLCVIAVAMLAACDNSASVAADPTAAATAAGATAAPAQETAAPAEVTEAPAAETEAPAEETKAEDAGASQVIDDNAAYKNELTDYQWVLMKVYQDGEEVSPATYYGSVIRQTGAYIEFKGDDTFSCSLGVRGCEGTYSIDSGVVTLHITTRYDGNDAGKSTDEDVTLKWDRSAGTIDFDYFSVTNEFSKRSEG